MPVSPVVSVVLGSYNRKPLLKLLMESLRRELQGLDAEIIVVDGGSNDGSLAWLTRQKDVLTIVQHNRGQWLGKAIRRRSWGYFMNLAFRCAQGRYVCMLSDDCLVVPGAIRNGISRFGQLLQGGRKVGGLAFYWRNWPGMDDYAVYEFWGRMNINHGLYLRSALEEVGYADEDTYTFYSGDVDLSFKLHHAGHPVLDAPDSFIEHYCHASWDLRTGNQDLALEDERRLVDKWRPIMTDTDFSVPDHVTMVSKVHEDPADTLAPFRRIHNSWRTRLGRLGSRVRGRLQRMAGGRS